MEEPKDKRTKAYKEWVKTKGMGDKVESLTKSSGIKKLVDKVSDALGVDCGCEARKEWLNERYPEVIVDISKDQFNRLETLHSDKKSYLSNLERKEVISLTKELINPKQRNTTCVKCIAGMYTKLMDIYSEII